MQNNKLIIAAAGSGKTTYLVQRALAIQSQQVLITTYTEANEEVIKRTIIRLRGYIPANITIQTWFTFLLQHGVRPFQSAIDASIHETDIGFYLTNEKSGRKHGTDDKPLSTRNGMPIFWGEDNFQKFYFTNTFKIYSDKISKFVVACNSISNGDVVSRIARVFDYVLVDEVQDLAGYDLELLKLLFQSASDVLLVGDPRQVTYLTHHSTKHKKYGNGNIKGFVEEQLGKRITCLVDDTSLANSHRNNQPICDISNRLYPALPESKPCTCDACRGGASEHEGVCWIIRDEVDKYLSMYQPIQLRWDVNTGCSNKYPAMNFGESKGLSFDRVVIYPTADMKRWLLNQNHELSEGARAKLYVAITRARHSVAIVFEANESHPPDDMTRYRCVGE